MSIFIVAISELQNRSESLSKLLDLLSVAGESSTDRDYIVDTQLLPFMRALKPDLKVVIEPGYVDTVYRDSFYCYYSSRLLPYGRLCVRLSFFRKAFDDEHPLSSIANLKDNYLGFLILRPLIKCIGRNVISPEAICGDPISICMTSVETTCLGVKLSAKGFPHASQDGETMTCAQTTIWSLLEYYGNKYIGYAPTKPTEIENKLEPFMYERLMPTTGLSYLQISVALRKLGFGPRIYSKAKDKARDFYEKLTCYIESGIPLAVAMQNTDETLGHAVVCCGRKLEQREEVLAREIPEIINGKKVYFWNKCIDTFVFNDDNRPCYQRSKLSAPARYYGKSPLSKMKIRHFIAPLYPRLYMDVNCALPLVREIVADCIQLEDLSVIRTFLTSTRSFRQHIVDSPEFTYEHKIALLGFAEPKFVWVTEIGTKENFCNGKVESVIVMDATGSQKHVLSSIIYIIDKATIHFFVPEKKSLCKMEVKDFPKLITSFRGNLSHS